MTRRDREETPIPFSAEDRVGSISVGPEDRVTCEVCGAEYHKIPGLRNDCPLCNAPGGKGAVISAVGAGTNPFMPAFEALTRSHSNLSSRVADLENKVKEIEGHFHAA